MSRAIVAEAKADDEEDAHLTIAEKAEKVRQAMEAYHALDHEDMVSFDSWRRLWAAVRC